MSSRLRKEVINDISSSGGLTDLIDSMIYSFYNITSDELDIICNESSDEELNGFMSALGSLNHGATISDIRTGISIRNKYINYFNENRNI